MEKNRSWDKIFLFFVYGLAVVLVYFSLNKNPCDETLTYSVGRIDKQFGIDKTNIQEYLSESSDLWNKAVNKNLLAETTTTKSDIVVNFIFDERQRATIQAERLKAQIAEQKENLGEIKSTIAELKNEYESKLEIYNNKKDLYVKRLESYNDSVSLWNKKGGAPEKEYNKLADEKNELEQIYNNLSTELSELKILADQITNYNEDHNQIVNQVNNTIDKVNVNAGKQFEEGVWDPNTNTITIYEYESILSLKRVLAHELGHAIGIEHVPNKNSIMYYLNGANVFKLSNEDISELKKVCKLK